MFSYSHDSAGIHAGSQPNLHRLKAALSGDNVRSFEVYTHMMAITLPTCNNGMQYSAHPSIDGWIIHLIDS